MATLTSYPSRARENRDNRSPEGNGSREFCWFVTSCFLSSLSRNGYFVACLWLLVADEAGSSAVAVFFIIVSLTELATSNLAGWLADKFDRPRLYIAADTVRCIALCCIAISFASFNARWTIWISGAIVAACDRVALTASQATIPGFSTRFRVSIINCVLFFFVQCGGLIGALCTGYLLYTASSETTLLVLAIGFGCSAASMWVVPRAARRSRSDRLVKGHLHFSPQLLLLFIVYALLYTGSMMVSVVGPSFVFQEHLGNAIDFGRLESAWSIGSIVGSLLLIPFGRLLNLTTFQIIVLIGMTLMFALLKTADLTSSLFAFVALGALYNFGRVTVEVMLQALVPPSALGRAKGILHCGAVFLGVLVFASIGISGDHLRPSDAFLAYSIFMALASAVALTCLHRKPSSA